MQQMICQTIVLEHSQANCPSVKKEMQTLCILFVKKNMNSESENHHLYKKICENINQKQVAG